MEQMPPIRSEKSDNTGVQALRDAIRLAWVDSSLRDLKKHLASAQQLNNDEGLLSEEIKICEAEIQTITEQKVLKFKETVSEDADKISMKQFVFESILSQNTEDKSVALLGKLRGDPTVSKAVVILSKTEF